MDYYWLGRRVSARARSALAAARGVTEYDEAQELKMFLLMSARLPAIEAELARTRARLKAADRAYSETEGGSHAKQRAVCCSLGFMRSDGKRGPTYNKTAVFHDYQQWTSGSPERRLSPRAAIAKLRRAHGFQSDDSCHQYLLKIRNERKELLESNPTSPDVDSLRCDLKALFNLPRRGGSVR